MEDGVGEEDGGGSGPKIRGCEVAGEDAGEEDVGEVVSGELGGFGKRMVFLSSREGWEKRPSRWQVE